MTDPDPEMYRIRPGSSVNMIRRAMSFVESSADFLELLDYMDDEEGGEGGEYQELLKRLEKRAMELVRMELVRKESGA